MTDTHRPDTARLKFGAVLLAAGAGSRLGGRPKSLLELDGTPLIRKLIFALTDNGVEAIVVVLGHYADAIEKAVQDLPVQRVRNPSPDDGQATSLRLGLQALSTEVDAVIVALADQPLITALDIADLIVAFKTRGERQLLVPRFGGEPGNPVIVDAALRNEWLAGQASATGQRWRQQNPARVHWFDTANDHYRVDIDTPDDVADFAARAGHSLLWPNR